MGLIERIVSRFGASEPQTPVMVGNNYKFTAEDPETGEKEVFDHYNELFGIDDDRDITVHPA